LGGSRFEASLYKKKICKIPSAPIAGHSGTCPATWKAEIRRIMILGHCKASSQQKKLAITGGIYLLYQLWREAQNRKIEVQAGLG
jgi:hypothetical protein